MRDHAKISGAFDAFMTDSGSNDKREAIVIYRASRDATLPFASKDPTERSKNVKLRADRQRMMYVSLADTYELEARRRLTREIELTTSPIGSHILPVAQVEVTSRTLPALAEHPDVVAILPNQKLHPIEPRAVDYGVASSAESKAGVTWGLKALGIPELWNETRGEQINVAVLDTGVHGDHPCLAGRVRKFLVIDPLGDESTPPLRSTATDTVPTSAGRLPEAGRRTESPLEWHRTRISLWLACCSATPPSVR